MTTAEQPYVRSLLQQHIANICSVHFAEYGKAQALCCVVKQLAAKYYSSHSLYTTELEKLNFTSISNDTSDKEKNWNSAIDKLLTVAHAMLDDTGTSSSSGIAETKAMGSLNSILLVTAFISLSGWIWFFHKVVQWQWFASHPRRIPLEISCQLLLLLLLFFTTKASRRQKENAAIITGIVMGMISLL